MYAEHVLRVVLLTKHTCQVQIKGERLFIIDGLTQKYPSIIYEDSKLLMVDVEAAKNYLFRYLIETSN